MGSERHVGHHPSESCTGTCPKEPSLAQPSPLEDVPTITADGTNDLESESVSARYINNEELEAWVEARFGPNSPFNRQLARDLLDWGVRVVLEFKVPPEAAEMEPGWFARQLKESPP